MAITHYPLLTVADAIDHTLDAVLAGDASPRSRRMATRAVQEAYAELPMRRNWRYFYRPFTIVTAAQQTTGSVAYTASSRSVTLTGTTWPSDVTKYALWIEGVRYGITTRTSSTVIVLDEKDAPTSDIAAGTEYTLARDTYELPDNLRKLLSLYDTSAPGRLIECVDPGDIIWEQRIARTASTPRLYSVYRSEQFASGMAIHFAPAPTSAITYQALGLFWPQPLKVLDYNLGTVSTTADSASVTGASTAFTSSMDGAVLRVSSSGSLKLPTDLQGEIDKNRLEPYALQRVIKSRDSATALTLEQVADTTLTTSGYRISSRIDIEPGSMRNAFLRCCEARFSPNDRKGAQEREAAYERALMLAMAADQRLEETLPTGWSPNSLADIAASVDLTTGGVQP
jgi:hypothetical protein